LRSPEGSPRNLKEEGNMRVMVVVLALLAAFSSVSASGAPAPATLLADGWRQYRERFVTAEGRVVDNANGGISHSEGQGYAMLIAERLDDRPTFETIWRWTQSNLLVRGDGLAAWRWSPETPHVADHNNATDGDLLIAWALAEASDRWHVSEYKRSARQIMEALATNVVASSRFGPILLPASTGFAGKDQPDGPVVNLSYWIFPSFKRLRAVSDAIDWDAITATGKTLIGLSRFGPRRLPSNWISVGRAQPEPASSFPAVFGYDAVRIPLYLAWGGPSNRDLLKSFLPLDLSVIDVKTGSPSQKLSDPDYGAIANLAECVGSHSPVQWKAFHGEFYYPATLHLLALIAADELSGACPQ
jgi:endoglucanase